MNSPALFPALKWALAAKTTGANADCFVVAKSGFYVCIAGGVPGIICLQCADLYDLQTAKDVAARVGAGAQVVTYPDALNAVIAKLVALQS